MAPSMLILDIRNQLSPGFLFLLALCISLVFLIVTGKTIQFLTLIMKIKVSKTESPMRLEHETERGCEMSSLESRERRWEAG